MNREPVVVTGLGLVSPLGSTVSSFWTSLVAGQSGIGPLTRFDASDLPVRFGGEAKGFDPLSVLSAKDARRLTRFIQFAVWAAVHAWRDAGLEDVDCDRDRAGVFIGSGMGALDMLEEEHRNLLDKGPGRVSPFLIPGVIVNMAAGVPAMHLGLRGPNLSPVTACASGAHAIGEAARTIQRGDADIILAGGAEAAMTRLSLAGFASAKALSTRNDDPAGASRPFDRGRDGFVMGEGAAVLVLERLGHAKARGARVLAQVAGYGASADAHHLTAPPPEADGMQRAILAAIRDASLSLADIGYINAHGTSTPANDKAESAGLRAVFGAALDDIPVSSIKSMTGHLLGAAGAVEAAATVLSLHHGLLPMTLNYADPDPDCPLDVIAGAARSRAVRAALSQNMGFGGQNAALVFSHLAH
ncbi:MAG: beta-ketoacyl-ACP synthase II [Candidatus Sericytochromatia bacterium]|nr:beta-ketoacyl-ACP synthase II [Candidatus Tanganyikabacteria bacterium]